MMICTESKWRKLVYTSRRRINRRLYNHNRFSLFCRIILYVQSSRTELCLWQKTSATWPRRKKQIGTGWRKPRRPSEIAVRPAPQERNSAPWASFKPSRSIHWICVQAPPLRKWVRYRHATSGQPGISCPVFAAAYDFFVKRSWMFSPSLGVRAANQVFSGIHPNSAFWDPMQKLSRNLKISITSIRVKKKYK